MCRLAICKGSFLSSRKSSYTASMTLAEKLIGVVRLAIGSLMIVNSSASDVANSFYEALLYIRSQSAQRIFLDCTDAIRK